MNASPDGGRPFKLQPWIGAALIVAAVALAWSNSFSAPFELDDESSIATNPTIRSLASLHWLTPPGSGGQTVGGRPVLNLSFAIDYAIGGLDVRWYHLTNVAIHALAALTLFGLVRRALLCPTVAERHRRAAFPIALAVAMLWAVHPLQTQAVTYIAQRAESLMTLFYLLTLYGFVRATDRGPAGAGLQPSSVSGLAGIEKSFVRRLLDRRWFVFSWAACLLGMGTKENMVSAPIVVLLLDRAFVAGCFAAAWRSRRAFYLALASTWVLLGLLVLSTGGNRGGSAGFDVGVGWLSYTLTQFPAFVRYAALCFWPDPLVFDYGAFFVTHAAAVAWPGVFVGLLIAGTAYTLWRHPKIGLLGATAFAVLAPTSLVPGTLQMIVEHRMYLPLASVVVLASLGCEALVRPHVRWLLPLLVGLATVALGGMTFARNRVYRSEFALWQDTAAKAPENPRAHNNLGLALFNAGQVDAAIAEFRRTIELQSNHAFAHANLGVALLTQRRWEEAASHLASAIAADPHYFSARVNLGHALTQLGRKNEAVAQYRAALGDDPTANDACTNLAALLLDDGKTQEAEALLRQVLLAVPGLAEAHYHYARVLEKSDKLSEAEAEYREASRLKPQFADAHLALGNTLSQRGNLRDAEVSYREAIRLDATLAEAHFALGNLLAGQQQFEAAMTAYNEALHLDPGHVQARNNLANCQLVKGKLPEAIANYEEVLRLRPQDEAVRRNLETARQLWRSGQK